MARIIKFSGYMLDNDEVYDEKNLKPELEYCFEVNTRHFHAEYAEFEWDRDHPLNDANCDLAECEAFFRPEPSEMTDRLLVAGEVYRHFKTGNLVKVLAIAQDTENVGFYSVIYECLDDNNKGKIWSRPLDMFLSPVDKWKYPDSTQKMRFEKVEQDTKDELITITQCRELRKMMMEITSATYLLRSEANEIVAVIKRAVNRMLNESQGGAEE